MYHTVRLLIIITLLGLGGGALAACSSEDDAGDASLNIAIEQPTGIFILQTVERDDRFPPGCEGEDCWTVRADGRDNLVLWVTPPDEVNISGAVTATDTASVVDGTGNQYPLDANGMLNNQVYITFVVPRDAQGFSLHWGDAEPVDLHM